MKKLALSILVLFVIIFQMHTRRVFMLNSAADTDWVWQPNL